MQFIYLYFIIKRRDEKEKKTYRIMIINGIIIYSHMMTSFENYD